MRLHNRQLKASFFNDGDLLQWPRDKRFFYAGLIQIADDSACLEDSSFSFKLLIFPSPQDSDLTIEQLSVWKDELIAEKKLISYTSQGKKCLYLTNFHKHQTLKNPSLPTVPLPDWITWIPAKSNPNAGKYAINKDMVSSILHSSCDVLTIDLDSSYKVLSNDLQKSYEVLTNVFQPKPEPKPEPEPEPEPKEYTDDDDNAQAREQSKNELLDLNPEEPKNPVQALGSKAITFAEVNFGRLLSPSETSSILDFCQEFENKASPDPDAIVIAGLKRCIDNDQRKMSYLKGIMLDWIDHGVVDLSHISLRDKEFTEGKKKSANKFKGGKESAKDIRAARPRINDSAAYDPSAWAKAGYAVST
ncbi:DnaD domain-containing protein [Desulfosporosinus metallidurans]|uniref:DnaB/C C-terminal domain-containing protein n=1 Tax=Desulfosporosinus metallidurans TaxID=1888891 RepID=A0A1Q8QRJ4_9FIRM|nr:DnaD domain protein [Desulfosporosinus metallidurans]OLN29936.1 hypothetical protein DSOL_3276 [Desulfosporosinus metallidurans]